MYKKNVVCYLGLLMGCLAIVSVVPKAVHAVTVCNACKGTGKMLEMASECPVRVQEDVTVGYKYDPRFAISTTPIKGKASVHPSFPRCDRCNGTGVVAPDCKYCGGTGKIYTAAEKEEMIKKDEAMRKDKDAIRNEAEAKWEAERLSREAEEREEQERKEAAELARQEEERARQNEKRERLLRQEQVKRERQQEKEEQRIKGAEKFIESGYSYHKEGNFKQAIYYYNLALEITPYNEDARKYLEMAKKKKKLKK
jgi:RecJ-like exonuclease